MFTIKINDETFSLPWIKGKNLYWPIITLPFNLDDSEPTEYFFKEYFKKIQPVEDGLQFVLLKDAPLDTKMLAITMLERLMAMYELQVRGIEFKVHVHENLRKGFGRIYIEKLLFSNYPDIWNFAPGEEVIGIHFPADMAERIIWIQNFQKVSIKARYRLLEIDSSDIYSLILA